MKIDPGNPWTGGGHRQVISNLGLANLPTNGAICQRKPRRYSVREPAIAVIDALGFLR
jgi:hypothetical protein